MPYYVIRTASGWKPLPIAVEVKQEPMRNPFRSWDKEGAKDYQDWLRR